MSRPVEAPAVRRSWIAPRLERIGTIRDVAGKDPPTLNQMAASKS